MAVKKLTTEQLVAIYMVKYNTNHATILDLRKFKARLSKVLIKNNKNYKLDLNINDLKKLEKGDNFVLINDVICVKQDRTMKDIEFSLLLNCDLDLLMECYTVLSLYTPDKSFGR